MGLIILVPGIDDTAKRMEFINIQLSIAGYENIHTIEIVPNNGSISIIDMAIQVLKRILELREQTGEEITDIIGYSMGAIVLRYIIQRLNGKEIFHRFVSIAAPHKGTITGYFRNGIGVRQMRPNSTLLKELNQEKNPWGNVKVYSFRTHLDLMVLPSKSSELDGAVNKTYFVLCHPCMTRSKRVIKGIIQALQS